MVIRSRPIRSRLALLATALAVFALGAVGTAQAFEWTIEGKTLAERGLSSQTTAGSKGSLTLSATVLGSPFKVSCTESSSGKISQGGLGENTLSLSGCAVAEPAGCTVAEPISLVAKTELTKVGGVFTEKLTPAAEKFGSIKIQKCGVAGTYPVKGSTAGKNEGYPTQQETHTVEFSAAISEAAGTQLTFNGQPATLSGSTREYLTTGAPWGTNKGSEWGHVGNEWEIAGSTLSAMGLTSEAIGSNSAPVKFVMTLLGSKTVIDCSMTVNGTIVKGGTGTATLNITSCVVSEPAGCSVSSSLITLPLKTSLVETAGKWYVKFEPLEAGGTIISVKISGCVMSGSYPWKGSFSGQTEPSGTQFSMQPLVFSAASSSITTGGNPVTITGTQLVSLSGKN